MNLKLKASREEEQNLWGQEEVGGTGLPYRVAMRRTFLPILFLFLVGFL